MASPQTGAPPGKQNGRPHGGRPEDAPSSNTNTHSLTELVAVAQRLVEQIGDQAAAAEAEFRMAYKLGYESGLVVGRQQLGHEILREEERFGRHMSTITRMRSYDEQERIRWDGRREDFSDPRPGDYQGGTVDWETSEPVPGQGAA